MTSSKLERHQVREIRGWIHQGLPNTKIARMYGVVPHTISNIKTGKSWAWLHQTDGLYRPGHWRSIAPEYQASKITLSCGFGGKV